MTRRGSSQAYWPRNLNGSHARCAWKTIPLTELMGARPKDSLLDRATGNVVTAALEPSTDPKMRAELETLDAVVHDFMGSLHGAIAPLSESDSESDHLERLMRIAANAPVAGGARLGPPVMVGMSPSIALESLLGLLGSLHKTGVLRVRTSEASFMISVVGGDVVHGVSHPRPEAELLGNILVSRGAIGRNQLDEFFERCGRTARGISEALNRQELVSTVQLRAGLETQLQQLFDRMLASSTADWCFHEGEATLSFVHLRMNAMSVLLESARKRDESNPA